MTIENAMFIGRLLASSVDWFTYLNRLHSATVVSLGVMLSLCLIGSAAKRYDGEYDDAKKFEKRYAQLMGFFFAIEFVWFFWTGTLW